MRRIMRLNPTARRWIGLTIATLLLWLWLTLAVGHGAEAQVAPEAVARQPADPDLGTIIKGLAGPVLSAAIGLLWRRAEEIRNGKEHSWRQWLLDVPSVVGIGIISGSIALWAGLPDLVAMGVACALGHVGTQWLLSVLLPRVMERWFPKPPSLD